jgi:hypothetical protein
MKVSETTECEVSITLDGKNYFIYDKKLLVYRNILLI